MQITGSALRALYTGFNTHFQAAFDAAPASFGQVTMVVPSNTKQETYGWMGKSTQFREWVGERVLQNLETHDYSIKNKSFENTIVVSRDDIEDDSLGVYAPLFSQLGMDAKNHPDELVFTLCKNGFTQTCFDGQYFFDTDHPVKDATGAVTSVSNYGGGIGTPWYVFDTSRAIKPFILQKRSDYKFVSLTNETDANVFLRKEYLYGVDARLNVGYGLWQLAYASKQTLDETNFAAALSAMRSTKNDMGKPMSINPTLLVVPPTLEYTARKLLNAEIISNNSNVLQGATQLLVTPWVS